MDASTTIRDALFEQGPPTDLQRRLGLASDRPHNLEHRAAFAVLIGWAPIMLLTLAQDILSQTTGMGSLLRETGVHARYAFAVPLLILAEAFCGRYLSQIIRHFSDAAIVRERQRPQFEATVASVRRLLTSRAIEIVVFMLAVAIVAASALSHSADQLPPWHKPTGGVPIYSLAGWWHVLVSLPLLIVLLLGWVWRYMLWTYLLWRITRLDLRLIASHPDGAAGLGFVGHATRAFAGVAMAIAAIAAGRSAHLVLTGNVLPTQNLLFNAGLLIGVCALFTAPALVFTPLLTKTFQRGAFDYGTLAGRVGAEFERQWLTRDARPAQDALNKPDFSATTDLYGIVANVHAMRLVPVDLQSLITIVCAMLLPFVPVVLLAVPMDTIWSNVRALLF